MNTTIPYLILLRYILLPKQLLSFDYAEDRDAYSFSKFYKENKESSLLSVNEFLDFINGKNIGNCSFNELSFRLAQFMLSLPFLDYSEFQNLDLYNPFKDFQDEELYSYFTTTDHFPLQLNPNQNIHLGFVDDYKKYYDWYNNIEDKSLIHLIVLYKEKLKKFYDSM